MLRGLAKTAFATVDLVLPAPSGPRILIYHQVGVGLGRQMEVGTGDFRRQIAWLAKHREVVDIETALQRWQAPGAERLVVLTFDDGYADLFTTAFPIMREAGMPFTLYVATDLIGEEAEGPGGERALQWDQVTEMLGSGLMTPGSHTRSHPDVRTLSTDQVEDELESSDAIIERELGVQSRHFAYPYGFWSDTADPVVRARYDSAVLGGSPRPRHAPDPHLLHRYPVQLSDGFGFFKARLRRGFRAEEALRRALKGYRGP